MSFEVIRNDITRVKADAIVNSANPEPTYGSGTDGAIYHAAGADALLAERKKIGRIGQGEAAATPAFALKAKYIIHTVGPVWEGGARGELDTLRHCYENSLKLAESLNCKSIAFPLISSGTYGFPKDQALNIALEVLQHYPNSKLKIMLVVYDAQSFELSGQIFDDIQAYVDSHYIEAQEMYDASYENEEAVRICRQRERLLRNRMMDVATVEMDGMPPFESKDKALSEPKGKPLSEPKEKPRKGASKSAVPKMYACAADNSLDDIVIPTEMTFQEKLFELIDERNIKDSTVYNEAHLSRQFFSKMRADKDYQPSKRTAIAICIVLKLSIEETEDLLQRAGLVLSPSNRFDLVVKGCIINKLYDFAEIDLKLIKNECDPVRKYK